MASALRSVQLLQTCGWPAKVQAACQYPRVADCRWRVRVSPVVLNTCVDKDQAQRPDVREQLETSMGMLLRDTDRHAERIMVMVESATGEQGNDPVTRSWSRCLNEYRLHPD